MITLIGLGNKKGDLSYSAYLVLKSAQKVYLRTELTQSAQILKQEGIEYISLIP